jgi:hypothetical protein
MFKQKQPTAGTFVSDVPTLSELTEPLPTSEEPIEAALISPMLTTGEPPAASPDPPGRFRHVE